MSDVDPISAFIAQVKQRFNTSAPETFWSCEDIYRGLLTGSFVKEMVNDSLRRLVWDNYHIGDWPPNQMMLHRGSGYALSISLFDTPRRYIHTTPFYGMYAAVSDVDLQYDFYELPAAYNNSVFDPALQLQYGGSGRVTRGEVLQIRSDVYAYDFKVEEPLLVLKFTTAPFHTLEWLFNKDSLRPWQANDADLSSTQLRVAAYILGRLSHQSSLEPLKMLASHVNPTVRWAGIQNLGRLSRSDALVRLKTAVNDPHPHIRRAAQKTLDRLNPKSPG